jgi:hypothetical protein
MARTFKRPDIPQLLSIGELFSRDTTLNIPKWQREYSWDADEEVRELLEDLQEFVSSTSHNYVLGSIITYPLPDGSHSVVDGQQRTITLYTLLIAARDLLEYRLISEFGSVQNATEGFRALYQTVDSITRKVSMDVDAKISFPIYMEYGGGNQLLAALAIKAAKPDGVLTISQTNIWNAYEKCRDFLEKMYPVSAQVSEFIRGVIQGTFIVETNVGDQRQALDIFFKMNERGRALEGADYLKNFMFQHLSDDKYDDLSDKWTEMSKALRSADSTRSKLKTPEFFLRNLAIVDKGEKISGEQGVYEYWQGKFKTDISQLENFLLEIQDKAKVFSKIAGNKLVSVNELNEHMVGADYFKGTQYLPVLLSGSHLRNYKHLSELVNYRYLIYILAQERTQDFESMVPRWAKAISLLSKDASLEKINQVTTGVPGLALDPVGLMTLEKRLEDLASPKDERKMRLIVAVVSLNFEVGLCDLSEFLKKYRPNKHLGFDTDLILNVDEIRATGVEVQSTEYREYLGLGNFALVNGQAKHYSNKPPSSKEDLYGNDKGVFTRALSSAPNSAVKDLNSIAKEIRKKIDFDLYNWDLEAIRERRSFVISEFISTIPKSLVP